MKKPQPRRKLKKKPVIISSLALISIISFFSIVVLLWPRFDTPNVFHIKIVEGMRKEEVAHAFGEALGWTAHEKQAFIAENTEGFLFPTVYDIPAKSKPQEVSNTITATFTHEVFAKEKTLTATSTNLGKIISIASIIEREAYSKKDMNIISGIIWNRLNKGMRLEMDATLQYANGSSTQWWPIVKSEDKQIDSPFNTYKHKGLPPTAIANPSLEAIDAALHPAKTNALFYIHDNLGFIHTANTYDQHLANISMYLW